MRIVSLVPAATEWLCSFGAETQLVGRSHACNFSATVEAVPAVTIPQALPETSAAIDREVRASLNQGVSLHTLDSDLIRELRPGLIITQDQCDVCAPSTSQLDALLSTWEGEVPTLVTFAPATLKQILDAALRLGRTIGREQASMQFIAQAEARLHGIRTKLGLHRRMEEHGLPTVVCIEWLDPIMTAGHWMPDVISMAGGRSLLARKGARSEYISWDTILEADPDVLLIAPCGFTIAQTRHELHVLTERKGWNALRAVRTGNVFLIDGNAYFNRPGPRIYRAIELVAAALSGNPDIYRWLGVEEWEMQQLEMAERLQDEPMRWR